MQHDGIGRRNSSRPGPSRGTTFSLGSLFPSAGKSTAGLGPAELLLSTQSGPSVFRKADGQVRLTSDLDWLALCPPIRLWPTLLKKPYGTKQQV